MPLPQTVWLRWIKSKLWFEKKGFLKYFWAPLTKLSPFFPSGGDWCSFGDHKVSPTMRVNPSCKYLLSLTLRIAQCLFHKLGRWEEILAEVKGRDIFRHHPVVYDVHVAVVTGPRVHIIPRPLCCVQDVRNPQPLQLVLVLRRLPARSLCDYYFNPPIILFTFIISYFFTHSSPM